MRAGRGLIGDRPPRKIDNLFSVNVNPHCVYFVISGFLLQPCGMKKSPLFPTRIFLNRLDGRKLIAFFVAAFALLFNFQSTHKMIKMEILSILSY